MKNIAWLSIILVLFFMVSSIVYVEQSYAQNASFSFLNMFPQGNYLQNYGLGLQNFQQSSSYERSLDFNLNTASGWLNHPPISVYSPTSPVVLKAGQTSNLTYRVIDPDAESFYSFSNLGATGSYADGYLNWSFSPNFPGNYIVDTVVYDERGGFSVMRSAVYVKPWWSY